MHGGVSACIRWDPLQFGLRIIIIGGLTHAAKGPCTVIRSIVSSCTRVLELGCCSIFAAILVA